MDQLSWWVSLTRPEFVAAIAARLPVWRLQKKPFLDHVGAKMTRDLEYPRREALRRDEDD